MPKQPTDAPVVDRFLVAHAPVSFSIGFLDAPFDTVVNAFQSWKPKLVSSVHSASVSGDLAALISQLEPLTMPPRRSLWLRTNSRWTAYLDNSILGTDAFGPIGYLAEILNCEGVILTCAFGPRARKAASKSVIYDAIQFEKYGPGADNPLGCIRSVLVARDGGPWQFDANGTPQDFEELESYRHPVVKNRFTPMMLERYAAALGIDAFRESFYLQDARVVSYANVNSIPPRECSLAEARRELGLED